ncbi:ubiquitin-conjugating enzyme e2 g1 [Limosa lapponica baueri]|uniref:Ubiquitin-conjugating enzyme E2 G1 n=23 Tax=Amniota TaxID=32524 RepID=A0A2I0TMG4_LIMLA|nr:ubiquitin-conjugating enzyme e2 g1 [Limosa lapponica baueri]
MHIRHLKSLLNSFSYTELNKNPVEGFSAGLIDDNDLYRWEVLIIGPPDTLYEGGVFKAHLTFPKDYPLRPPKMKFITEIWHPNVDKNGDVCISILHEPGEDKYGYEKPEERWLPIHTVETIMISVISMLADPNGDSPANVDAAKEWREDRNGEFKRKVARCVRKSQETAFEDKLPSDAKQRCACFNLVVTLCASAEEVAKLEKHLMLLRQEYVKLQKKLADTERRCNLLAAQANQDNASDTFISRLLAIVAELYQQEQYSFQQCFDLENGLENTPTQSEHL